MDVETTGQKDFHLYCQLFGHTADVRDVAGLSGNMIASCSRDGTIKIWSPQGPPVGYEVSKSLAGHTNVNKMGISALHFVPPGVHPVFKEGCLVSAGYDKGLCVWDSPALRGEEETPTWNLWGHEEAPTCISVTVDGCIISGGSDNVGRVWGGNRCIEVLRGHKYPIWAIIGLANGDIVTGSGDRNIKIWRRGQCIKTIAEHKDAVRGLTDLPGLGFVSSSNDGTVILWTYDGTMLQVLNGHEGFVYKVTKLPTGELVTASEDKTIKIWKDGACVQTLVHPSGLWSVSTLENGDIVAAGQDGVIRVWSRDETRKASDEVLASFSQEIIEKSSIASNEQIDVDALPGPEALEVPGTKEGQYKKIKKDGKAHIYTWSIERNTWDYIGEIQGVQSNEREKKIVNGMSFDFVFDVDLGDGDTSRKLTFNLGEDPYMAAQYFIESYQLDQNFLDEIAKFIIKNVPNWKDAKSIPFSRSNKPAPQNAQKPQNTPQPQVEFKIPPSTSKYFPQCKPVTFEGGNFDQILGKIKSINQTLADAPDTAALALAAFEISQVETVFNKVSQTSRYHVSTFTPKEFGVIEKLLKWPLPQIFPVLDFLRIMIFHPEAAQYWTKTKFVKTVLETGLNPGGHTANAMLTFRFASNLFMLPSIRSRLFEYQEKLLDFITDKYAEANKTTRLTLSTTILNFSVLYLTEPNEDGVSQTLSVLNEVLGVQDQDEESLFRLLVALGTMLYAFKERQSLAEDLGITANLDTLTTHTNEKIKNCATEIRAFFK
eukprot:TRINITY_DN16478_c0_g1_i1.p1 TRINITY_DN16478_c0_g1~~TRINITY_DN16478_c0_g1_i1.p1  ORF type:complete len:780 (-),score=188.30 TRINITY_DN16478_c0_g1_i1:4-2313(-)